MVPSASTSSSLSVTAIPNTDRTLRTRSPNRNQPSPGFVLSSPDLRRTASTSDIQPNSHPTSSTSSNTLTPTPAPTTAATKKRKQSSNNVSQVKKQKKGSQVKSVPNVIDVNQDSSSDNEAATPKQPTKAGGVQFLLSYFGEPKHKPGESGSFKRWYPCLWCGEYLTRGRKTNSNLYGHRDGEPGRLPCDGRKRAIKAGMVLPPTHQQMQKAANAYTASGKCMQAFINKPAFSVEILNIILVIWIVRHAIAWRRFSDLTLRAAFKLSNPSADMRSPTWAAQTARTLYKSLHSAVLKKILNNTSRVWLLHDVWTTKGNRHAFIALMACYVDEHFRFQTMLLTLKMVSWNHYGNLLARPVGRYLIRHGLHKKILGQTTDSGSNNGTMAMEMAVLFAAAEEPVEWNSNTMHARCYCHKLALVVKAGLKALSIDPGHTKPTTDMARPFPIPTVQLNNGEDDLQIDSGDSDIDDPLDDTDQGQGDREEDLCVSVQPTLDKHKGNIFGSACNKVDYVSKKIAGSHSRRLEFKGLVKDAGMNYKTPIAGYGIRWNVIYDSRTRMCAAQEIVNKMLSNDRKSTQYFKGTLIHADEWEAIEALNQILEIFSIATKRMEGDFLSGAMVLVKYNRIKKSLAEAQKKTPFIPLKDMINVMQDQLDLYLSEALECDALVLATILHPRYRLAYFDKFYPEHKERGSSLIRKAFETALKDQPVPDSTPAQTEKQTPATDDIDDDFDEFTASSNHNDCMKRQEAELEAYLMGQREFDKTNSPLDWWMTNQLIFPVLSVMARDYLAISGTTCPAERVFSSAADVATTDRGGLLPQTISRCVASREWLKCNVEPEGGDLAGAVAYLKWYSENEVKKKSKVIVVD